MSHDEVNETTATRRRKPRYFYGWNIVGASFLAHLSYAEQYASILGFFFKPLQREFGWSRSAIAAIQSTGRIVEALTAPLVGPLVDKYGPRLLMPIGAVIVGVAMLGITRISAIWQFYLLRGFVVAFGFTLMGFLVTGVAINNWFVKKRGRAHAISRITSYLSNVIFIPVTVLVVDTYGWRMMFVIFAIVTWLVVLIPSAIFMRRRPEDMGLYPDGIEPGTTDAKTDREGQKPCKSEVEPVLEPVWNRREVLRTKSFWLLAIVLGFDGMAFQGINISLAPYIQDLDYSEAVLVSVMTFRALIGGIMLPLAGFFAERAHKSIVRVAPFVIQATACFLFLLSGKPTFLWLAAFLYGVGQSTIQIVQEVLWANYFGRLSLGLVRSLAFFIAFGFSAIGPIAMNAAFDVLGSYGPAFIAITVGFIFSAFIIWVVRPPKAHRYATAAEMTPSAGQHQLH